eukprot:TRINITY_DN12409_c0_g1_i1.p1 TRINITY_DN12409_c0_g1~~TRINITY_DN12409_c0_g1_i1.p1  ORF type:complete len:390 (-),score=136.35 TRINITY_DN12409_c0_g1_i1:17-1186(-)
MAASGASARSRAISMPASRTPALHSFTDAFADVRAASSPLILNVGGLAYPHSRALTLSSQHKTAESLPLVKSLSGIGAVDTIRNTTIPKAVYNILCCTIGAGAMGLPGTLGSASWWGLLPMCASCAVLHSTGQWLTQCILDDEDLVTFRDLGEKAFGWLGQASVLVCQSVNCIGTAVLFIVLAGQNLRLMLDGTVGPYSIDVYLTTATAIALPFCFLRNVDDMWWVSLAGFCSSVGALLCITGSVLLHSLPHPETPVQYAAPTPASLLAAVSVAVFAFGGHAAYPGILRVMRDPDEFPVALSSSFSIVAAVCLPFAALGYYAFGATLRDNVLQNLTDTPLRAAGILAITAHVLFAFAPCLNPVFYVLEAELGIEMATGAAQSSAQVAGR